MAKQNSIVEDRTATAEIPLFAALRSEWTDALEREEAAKAAIANLQMQVTELEACISDARLHAAASVPIGGNVQGIREHAAKKRQAQDEADALQDAKTELLAKLAKQEREFRGFALEKSGIREGMFRFHFDALLQQHKPLIGKLLMLGLQRGLPEQLIVSELFAGCDHDLNKLMIELGIPS